MSRNNIQAASLNKRRDPKALEKTLLLGCKEKIKEKGDNGVYEIRGLLSPFYSHTHPLKSIIEQCINNDLTKVKYAEPKTGI